MTFDSDALELGEVLNLAHEDRHLRVGLPFLVKVAKKRSIQLSEGRDRLLFGVDQPEVA